MANAVPVRIGQVNGAGATDALFQKVFPAEVIKAFEETNVMMPRHMTRSISNGKSAGFPVMGKASAEYHTVGTELSGMNAFRQAERVISIDSLLLSHEFVANIDEAMSAYEVRGELAKQMGAALARQADQRLLRVATLAARATATITGQAGGSALTHANAATSGSQLVSLIYSAAQTWDEKDVAEGDRYVAVKPAQYYLLVQDDKLLNRDFGGANGVYSEGDVWKAAGVEIVKSNNLPSAVVPAVTGENNVYNGDFTKTVAVAWHRSAFGTVKLLDLATEKDYQVNRQGTLMVAKYAMGHGILRPESAIEIATP